MSTETGFQQTISDLEQKLAAAHSDLEESNKQQQEFIQIASHDLQAPLRKLCTFVERLTHKTHNTLNSDAQLYITKINSTVETMQSLLNDLSELAEINEAGLEFAITDLNDVINEAIHDNEAIIKNANAKVSVSKLPKVRINRSQMKTVFKNLLDNSIKFKRTDTEPEISITAELLNSPEVSLNNLEANKVYHKIVFKDNGIGFQSENAERIFEPFQRLHGKATYPGNGLGLAICKKIIKNHHGTINAGAENSGTVINLILPETL